MYMNPSQVQYLELAIWFCNLWWELDWVAQLIVCANSAYCDCDLDQEVKDIINDEKDKEN